MCWTDKHLDWLLDTGIRLNTADGVHVPVFEFRYEQDEEIMSAWAAHFRNHYCSDREIDDLRRGFGLSRSDYLLTIKFPDGSASPGPSVRAGDFGEILIADYVQFRLDYEVPRTRYCWKANRNESTKGVDVLGFRMRGAKPGPKDELITFEVKCALSPANTSKKTLINAIADSTKDYGLRKAESLNATYQRLRVMKRNDEKELVRRFQKSVSYPYIEKSGGAAIHSTSNFSNEVVQTATAAGHPNLANLILLVVLGEDLMTLAHELYRRAANDA